MSISHLRWSTLEGGNAFSPSDVSRFFTGCLLSLFMLVSANANASQVTFAQFQQNSAGSPFVFTNAGNASGLIAANVPVNFQYLVPNGYGLVNQNIAAHLSLSAVVSGPAVTAGILVNQDLEGIDISITADTPVNGKDLLLQVTVDTNGFSTGSLMGLLNGHIALQSSDTDPQIAHSFRYLSDFVPFNLKEPRNYAFSFSSVVAGLTVNGNGYLDSFVAAGTGTFAGALPEPGAGGLAALGAGLTVRKVRRRTGKAPSINGAGSGELA